ncbi:MAG: aminoacyl-tRNA hydrolase [Chlamydiae bacterium]|nr:aminoacyl-tRNA hydrolase [Chlamydiota bacterium]
MDEPFYLVAGLGNPGKSYEKTRHNAGFQVVRKIAEKYGFHFKTDLNLTKGYVAEGVIKGKKTVLLMPLVYMNHSGVSVEKCREYFKVPLDHLLIIVDDASLPFKKMRLKMKGSSGGHKGLESVEKQLQTTGYPRLRIGIGRDLMENGLAEYVLRDFTREEQGEFVNIEERATKVVETWLDHGIEAAMRLANVKT